MEKKNLLTLAINEVCDELNRVEKAVKDGQLPPESVEEYVKCLNDRITIHAAVVLKRDKRKGDE